MIIDGYLRFVFFRHGFDLSRSLLLVRVPLVERIFHSKMQFGVELALLRTPPPLLGVGGLKLVYLL